MRVERPTRGGCRESEPGQRDELLLARDGAVRERCAGTPLEHLPAPGRAAAADHAGREHRVVR